MENPSLMMRKQQAHLLLGSIACHSLHQIRIQGVRLLSCWVTSPPGFLTSRRALFRRGGSRFNRYLSVRSIVSDSSKNCHEMVSIPFVCVTFSQAQCEFTEVNIETSKDEWGEELSGSYISLWKAESLFRWLRFKGSLMGRCHQTIVLGRWLLDLSSNSVGRWVAGQFLAL